MYRHKQYCMVALKTTATTPAAATDPAAAKGTRNCFCHTKHKCLYGCQKRSLSAGPHDNNFPLHENTGTTRSWVPKQLRVVFSSHFVLDNSRLILFSVYEMTKWNSHRWLHCVCKNIHRNKAKRFSHLGDFPPRAGLKKNNPGTWKIVEILTHQPPPPQKKKPENYKPS